MKAINWLLSITVIALACFATACSKSAAPPTTEPMDVNGVKVDLPKFTDTFANCSPEQKALVSQVESNVRYGQYIDAMMNLDKLSKDPSLTPPQKEIVGKVMDQMKQLAAKSPPPQ